MTWEEDQVWEAGWWGSCVNTFGEEAKQITYAHRMGLVNEPRAGKWPVYDLGGKAVLDVGGGPVSMLLKCVNLGAVAVLDPCEYPTWVAARYAAAGISYLPFPAEHLKVEDRVAEAWLYNVLQHVKDPVEVLETCKRAALVVRVFEWVDTFPAPGHPHVITADLIRGVLGLGGEVADVNENGAVGRALFGVFG